jgi:hypothetical protein
MSEAVMTMPNRSRLGWALSALVTLALLADVAIDLFAPGMVAPEMQATGFPSDLSPALGLIILICVCLYAYPKTAVLGAILVTGFLGGAIATHFRLGEIGTPPQLVCVGLGLLAWGGLYFRDSRVRSLLPFVA